MSKIKEFLISENGKRIIYELKSFAMTFTSIFIPLLLINPELKEYYNTGIPNLDLLKELGLSSAIALSRSLLIYLFAKFGFDYRKSTSEYNK